LKCLTLHVRGDIGSTDKNEKVGGERQKEKYCFFLAGVLHAIFNFPDCTRKQLVVCVGKPCGLTNASELPHAPCTMASAATAFPGKGGNQRVFFQVYKNYWPD